MYEEISGFKAVDLIDKYWLKKLNADADWLSKLIRQRQRDLKQGIQLMNSYCY